MKKRRLINTIVLLLIFCHTVSAQTLYVGANYHPHDDKNMEKIKADISLMKEAGFTAVRMGHLAWDSYEPTEGNFDFGWFDKVMDMMHSAGIKVLLDIAIRPAPIWLHHKYPSIDVVDADGNRMYPNHRYMEDVGDTLYQKYAVRYADAISRHYARHPALLAFGIDNESGDGPISYSETVRKRFIAWLQNKYSDTDNLNSAWATQRWSRRINDFDEVGLPMSGTVAGAPERVLDFRRFVSDEVNGLLLKVMDTVNKNAPHALLNTNAWFYSPMKYFDYSSIAYSGKMTREGCGFYPGSSLNTNWGLMNSLFGIARIQYESTNPFWCSEFTTMTAVPGSIRKSAYATLMYGNQMVCGWTWQSMHSGEEQYLEGLLDWDGIPNRKYDEYKQIATEFRKIGKYFPYKLHPEIGLSFSFPSQIASSSFPEKHDNQLQACFDLFYYRNIDVNVLDISKSMLNYKLLIVPGVAVMDDTMAEKIRCYVQNGGTVVMTSNSAIVDEHGKVFDTTRPGRLADVFGIRVAGYEEVEAMNELSRKSYKGKRLSVLSGTEETDVESARFDVIDSRQAEVLAVINSLDRDYPVMTAHDYGKGRAIYVGLPANSGVLSFIIDKLIAQLGIKRGPEVPLGVMARNVDDRHVLYLNTTPQSLKIGIKGTAKSLLYDKNYHNEFELTPYEPDFIELGK
jgi:beta-galactosidase